MELRKPTKHKTGTHTAVTLVDEHLQAVLETFFLRLICIEFGYKFQQAIEFKPFIEVVQSYRNNLIPIFKMFIWNNATCSLPVFYCQLRDFGVELVDIRYVHPENPCRTLPLSFS